jgi:predicted cupin superfamily sugar epimerase
VDATELWLFHSGSPLLLRRAASDAGPVESALLGVDVLRGETPQILVPAHHWQSAETTGGWGLITCIVSPAFEFSGFELAKPDWAPGK